MIVVQVSILDPQKKMVQNPKMSTYFKWISGFVGKCNIFHIFSHQDWLIDLNSMKASEIGHFHAPNPPAAKFSGAKVGMGFFVGLLGSLTTWDV